MFCLCNKIVNTGLVEKKKMNNFVFSGNSIIKPSAFNLQSSLLRLSIQKYKNCAFSRLYSTIKLPNLKLNFCIKLFNLTHKVVTFFKPGLVGCVPGQVGCNPVIVGQNNDLVHFDSDFVWRSNDFILFDSVFVSRKFDLIRFDSVFIGDDKALVRDDKNLVRYDFLLVGVRNILVGDDDIFGKFRKFKKGVGKIHGFLFKFFVFHFANLKGIYTCFELNRNNLQSYFNN